MEEAFLENAWKEVSLSLRDDRPEVLAWHEDRGCRTRGMRSSNIVDRTVNLYYAGLDVLYLHVLTRRTVLQPTSPSSRRAWLGLRPSGEYVLEARSQDK